MITDIREKLQDLDSGITSIDDLQSIIKHLQNQYKIGGKQIDDLIDLESFKELKRRLQSSVFGIDGESYEPDFIKFCISSEYKNTILFINSLKKIFDIAIQKNSDVSDPSFYGQPDPGLTVPLETIVHLAIRHNSSINKFINPDSKKNGYKPSSFSPSIFSGAMLNLFMALNAIEDSDWKKATKGKNLICHFKIAGEEYTIIRKGESKEIKSFYPRNDDHSTNYIELERDPKEMTYVKK